MRPSGGQWRVIVEDGSSPITSLKVAHALDAPKIDAKLAGRPYERSLRFAVEQRPGQVVSFIERGASTSGEIGTAYAAKGELPFVPAGGAAETREIVAVVEQDGMVSEQRVVARYRAPGAQQPGMVQRLRSQRLNHNGLRVAFKKAPRGDRHVVTVALSDGRRIVRQVDGRSLTLRGIERRTRAKVGVRAVSESGVLGRTARLKVR
jgi:hypothetical protein